jgi:4-hydroxybenzoate polyprenyltransferase
MLGTRGVHLGRWFLSQADSLFKALRRRARNTNNVTCFTQAAQAIVSSVLMNVAIVGINQVYDKKLDRVGV